MWRSKPVKNSRTNGAPKRARYRCLILVLALLVFILDSASTVNSQWVSMSRWHLVTPFMRRRPLHEELSTTQAQERKITLKSSHSITARVDLCWISSRRASQCMAELLCTWCCHWSAMCTLACNRNIQWLYPKTQITAHRVAAQWTILHQRPLPCSWEPPLIWLKRIQCGASKRTSKRSHCRQVHQDASLTQKSRRSNLGRIR
mmetsp:Transcript_60976/g.96946  ORF Transcript_60976/g.96946 Transcript_60976/m.96946 type:complete len:203 (+) Transcript_60976:484-1092(+)